MHNTLGVPGAVTGRIFCSGRQGSVVLIPIGYSILVVVPIRLHMHDCHACDPFYS